MAKTLQMLLPNQLIDCVNPLIASAPLVLVSSRRGVGFERGHSHACEKQRQWPKGEEIGQQGQAELKISILDLEMNGIESLTMTWDSPTKVPSGTTSFSTSSATASTLGSWPLLRSLWGVTKGIMVLTIVLIKACETLRGAENIDITHSCWHNHRHRLQMDPAPVSKWLCLLVGITEG